MPDLTPQSRFSDRVADYKKYRPAYPPQVIDIFRNEMHLRPDHVIADVGAGTGISTKLFLNHGHPVYAIEPNAAMRAAATKDFADDPRFHPVDGSAEHTTLPAQSVDFVVAAQAFHWFDRPRAKAEFTRILRPTGYIALIWNNRHTTGSPFLEGYESLLKQLSTDYHRVNHADIPLSDLAAFLGPRIQTRTVPNEQRFDLDAFLGRAFSSSYTPPPTHPDHARFRQALTDLFTRTNTDGRVTMSYATELHFAPVS